MSGIFCSYGKSEDYATDEAYRNIVKRKAVVAGCLMALGIVAIAAFTAAKYIFMVEMDDFMSGFFVGAGTGLFFAGGALMIKRIMLLKDEKKLKKARIAESDERNRTISEAALRAATVVLLVAMYIVIIASVFAMQELIKVMSLLICLFLAAYVVSYRVLQKKM